MITDRDSDSTETQENVVGREEKHYGKVENSQSLDIVQKSIIFFKTVINDLIKSPLKLFVLFLSAFLFFSAVYSRYLSLQSDTYLFYELIGVSRTNAIILSVLLSFLLFFSRHNKFFIVIFNYIFWYMLFYKIYSISLFRNEQYLSLIYILSIIFTYISVALIFHGLRYLFFIFYFLFLPIVLFVANYLSIYGSFGMEAIEALYQTNYNEAKDYFINMLNYNISSFIIILYGF